jgi:hypothetical protein
MHVSADAWASSGWIDLEKEPLADAAIPARSPSCDRISFDGIDRETKDRFQASDHDWLWASMQV